MARGSSSHERGHHMEMTFRWSDAYTGSIKFATGQMNMTVKLTGHKTGESCANPQ